MHRMLLLGLLLVGGCTQIDPYARPGAWLPSGVATRNLAAMLADPQDMVRGHGVAEADAPLAQAAVTRLWRGEPKPLPNATSQSMSITPSNSAGAGGGAQGGS